MAGARNVVGFNGAGIEVDNGGQHNIIQGNFSGVGADGVTPVGNLLHGIVLRSSNGFGAPLGPAQANEPGVSGNIIGGTAAGAGQPGRVQRHRRHRHLRQPRVRLGPAEHRQHHPGQLDLPERPQLRDGVVGAAAAAGHRPDQRLPLPRDDGFTANDSKGHGAPNDPNNFQNFPVLTSAHAVSGGTTTITGTLNGGRPTRRTASSSSPTTPTRSGLPAEGQKFLGFVNVTTDGERRRHLQHDRRRAGRRHGRPGGDDHRAVLGHVVVRHDRDGPGTRCTSSEQAGHELARGRRDDAGQRIRLQRSDVGA